MTEAITQYRLRITFSKLEMLRFIGHLDLAKTWERVLRRAELPLVYSQGFNPQPKIQLASALSLGISSDCELLDIWLREPLSAEDLAARLNAVSPDGLVTTTVMEVPLKAPALQTLLAGAHYRITVDEVDDAELRRRITTLLAADFIERQRRKKNYDLRALIFDLVPDGDGAFRAHLSLGQAGTGRPDEVLDAMNLDAKQAGIHRYAIDLKASPDP